MRALFVALMLAAVVGLFASGALKAVDGFGGPGANGSSLPIRIGGDIGPGTNGPGTTGPH